MLIEDVQRLYYAIHCSSRPMGKCQGREHFERVIQEKSKRWWGWEALDQEHATADRCSPRSTGIGQRPMT